MFDMDRNKSLLLVIDIQDRLALSMQKEEFECFFYKTKILINGCNALRIPILQSLQYKKGLGESVDGLFIDGIQKIDFEKRVFSCCYENSELLHFLENHKSIKQIIIAGMEAHVCVLQTARDLKKAGFDCVVSQDCIISRDANNKQNAINLLRDMHINVSNMESILFDLLKTSNIEEFKVISNLVK